MDACNAVLSAVDGLNEQVARQVFEAVPESGLVLAILDRRGNCWPSDSDAFSRLGLDETLLNALCARVDDGVDPARVSVGDAVVTVTQLATEQTNCGYLVLVEPPRGGDPTRASQDLVEVLFSQISLVARLVEQQGRISDAQVNCYSAYGTRRAPAN